MRTVLIVDDEIDICEMMSFTFETNGYKALIAHDAKQAFHLVKSEHPDLVVSDIRMPHGGGMTLLREVKQWNPVHPKIFLMTGYLDDSLEEAIAEGAEDVFLKPLKLQEIVDRVSQVFERSNTAT